MPPHHGSYSNVIGGPTGSITGGGDGSDEEEQEQEEEERKDGRG